MDGLSGRIEVIAGCMFSGKSEELIRRLKRAQIARQRVIALKSSLDNRYGLEAITSHGGKHKGWRSVKSLKNWQRGWCR